MKLLMQNHEKDLSYTNRKSIRWDKKILSLCLTLWIRSPSNNQQLRKSNVLSYHDPGNLVISYKKFSDLVPYHFILTEVFRQKEGMP